MTAKSNGRQRHLVLLGVGLIMALAGWGDAALAAAPLATSQPAADASKGKPGELIWASSGTQEGGRSVGKVVYSVAVDAQGVYVIGDKAGGAIIEKLNPRDGSPVWKPYQTMAGSNEGMHLAIDKHFLYAVAEPWMLEKRKLSDGSLIWQKKGEGGKPYTVVIDSVGAYMGGHRWQVEKRSLEDGSLLWRQKGPSGVVLTAAIDATGVYFGGYDTEPGDQQWRIEKRDLKDGSLIWVQNVNPSKQADKVYGMAVDATGVYAAGEDETAGTGGQWRIEKRSPKDGKLIWKQTNNPTGSLDKAHGLAADSTGVYIQGYQSGNQWRAEKRSLTDGKLIWEALSVNGRLWYGITVDDEAVYLGGYTGGGHGGQWRVEKRAK